MEDNYKGLIALKEPYDIYSSLYVIVKDKRVMEFLNEPVEFGEDSYKNVTIPVINEEIGVSIGSPDNDKALELTSISYEKTHPDVLEDVLKINGRSIDKFYESFIDDGDEVEMVEETDEVFDKAVEKIMAEHNIDKNDVYFGLIY